ncbi:MAG: flagellar biosynthetic protein FliR [Paracoccaceae bacterium]
MNESLLAILSLLDFNLWSGFVVFLRVSALTALLPAFGERTVSVRIKLALAVSFTFIITPVVASKIPQGEVLQISSIILSEPLSGALLGIGVRLLVLALQTAGTIAAQSTSLSQILGGASVDPLPAMGFILVIGAICLAVTTGLHVKAAKLLIYSYELFPVAVFSSGNGIAEWGVDKIRHAFSLAFTLSAPFLILSLLYNLALGAINKAMPQLMVAFVGAPVITMGGLFLLCLTAPLMLSVWLEALNSYLFNPMAKIQ